MKQEQHNLNKSHSVSSQTSHLGCVAVPRFIRHMLFSIVVFCISSLSQAQNSIVVKPVNLPQPFDHSEIKNMMLDNDGFLWFVTNQGIWRFDGTDVQPVDIHDPALPQNSVPGNIYHYHNFLFFVITDLPTASYRILEYDIRNKRVQQFNLPGMPSKFKVDRHGALIFITADGSFWSFTDEGGLTVAARFYGLPGWIKGRRLENYTIDQNGDIYIFLHERAGLVGKKGITWSDTVNGVKKITYVDRAYCTAKYIVALYNNGLVVYDKKALKKVYEYVGPAYQLSLPSKDGMLPVKLEVKDMRTGEPLAVPGTNKYLAGTDKGIIEIQPSDAMPFETVWQQRVIDFFKNKSIRCIYRAPNNKLYIGTYQGFFVFDGKWFKKITAYVGYTIEPVSKDMLLVGMEGGTGFFLVDTRTDTGRLNPGDSPIFTTKIINNGHGYYTGSYNNVTYSLTPLPNGYYKTEILLRDPRFGSTKDLKFINGQLWIACQGGLFKLAKNGKAQKIYPAGSRALQCYTIQENDGGIWLGTNGEGLVKIDTSGKVIKELHFTDGLAGEYVYSLLILNKLMIAGTSGGVSVFDLSSMQALNLPEAAPYNGSLSQEFNHSAMFYDTAKRQVVMGGTQGLAILDADYLRSHIGNTNDQVRLSYIKKSSSATQKPDIDLFAALSKKIIILPQITYAGLKFSGPVRQQFVLFRIKELDDHWHQTKLSDEISLYAIPPGTYTIEARFPSVTNHKYWLTEQLVVVPRFYQTLLFKILVVLAILLAIYLAWRYNANKIRQEQQMRTAIASDLHDEIGSTLTRISINSELLTMGDSGDKDALEIISNDSKKAISSISDIIWSVDARNDNKEDLVLRMKDHAHKMLEDIAEVHYSVSGLSSTANIPQSIRQNIYLIFKEAVNNIIRHNISPEVWINLENGPAGFTMEVKNTIQHKKGTGYKGQGLKNMEMRAKRINASVRVAEGDGIFSVTLRMKEWK